MLRHLTGFAPLGLVVAALVTGGGFEAAAAPSAVPASSRCEATQVHYKPRSGFEAGLAPYPWVAATPAAAGIVGHLFYYAAVKAWMRAQAPGLEIYAGGQTRTEGQA